MDNQDTYDGGGAKTQTTAIQAPMGKMPMPTGAKIAPLVPRTFEEVWRIATMMTASGLAPRDLNTPERVSVAIMHGLELGFPPMMAVQRIAVINGRPSVWGDAVPAVALATGQLGEWSEKVEGEGDAMTATCRVVRRMGGTVMVKEATFSVLDAKRADLWDERPRVQRKRRDGGTYEVDNDSPWHCYPKRMLAMRARVAFRDLFADAMCGLYIAEELVGRNTDSQMRDITPTRTFEQVDNPLGAEEHVDPETGEVTEVKAPVAAEPDARELSLMADGDEPPAAADPPPPVEAKDTGTKGRTSRKTKPAATEPAPQTAPVAAAAPKDDDLEIPESLKRPAADKPAQADEVFPTPYPAQTASSYAAYASRWISVAATVADARQRWNAERTIRNNLRDTLSEAEFNELQAAMGRVGKVDA